MAADCIYCKILNNELPSWRVYEDDKTLAILDLGPVAKGHTLVIPKKHVADIFDIDEALWLDVTRTAKKVAHAVIDATKADGLNFTINNKPAAGQAIYHLHLHLIPRYVGDGLQVWPKQKYAEGELDAMLTKIKSKL